MCVHKFNEKTIGDTILMGEKCQMGNMALCLTILALNPGFDSRLCRSLASDNLASYLVSTPPGLHLLDIK